MSRRAWYLTVGLAFAIHNAEEATAAPRMLNFMQSSAPMAFRVFYQGINSSELRFSLVVLTLVGMLVTVVAARMPTRPSWAYAMLVFAAVIGLNALAHVTLSVIFQTYMPGLVTAVILTLPVAITVLVRGRRDKWVSSAKYWTLLPAAFVIHGPILVLFIRTTIRGLRALTGSAA